MDDAVGLIHGKYQSFSAVEKKIADFILEHPETVIYMTTAVLAKELGVSQGSIVHFANALGFGGYSQLKLSVAQHLPNHEKIISEQITAKDSAKLVLEKLSNEVVQSFQMTLSAVSNKQLEQAAEILTQKKRIEIYGVGSSSMVANDAYYRFMRQGLPAYSVIDPHIASVSASLLDQNCVVVAVSYSGRTVETLKSAQIAKEKGASIIALTSFSKSPLAKLSDVCLVSASKETDRLKEATAARHSQLLLLDALLMYISFKNIDKTIAYTENIAEIIGEHRIDE